MELQQEYQQYVANTETTPIPFGHWLTRELEIARNENKIMAAVIEDYRNANRKARNENYRLSRKLEQTLRTA